ncbi:putative transmembrane component of ABC transporter [Candidatus Vecturithrix granuli]|uniref:Putative transmembrane component of ABC transporter n=1 Tax=Vecturithrix granuli TaxID=1499967 RepID=A0A081BZ68_VECG1|nr:putative transmembrane component of ABC transporter [Candidatus Vecturithrix granuli]
MKYRRLAFHHTLLQSLRVFILIIACLAVLIPLAYLLINSLKLPREFLTVPPTILPTEVTFEHYQQAFGNPKTSQFFTNSLIVSSVTTVVTIVFGTLAAYGLARMGLSSKWLSSVVFMFLFIRFYPRVTTVIPYFLIMRQFKLLDTVWAIIVGHLGITIPFVTWLMLIVFNELPKEVEEAAVVDGANPWQRFWHVVLPMTAPGVASAAILTAFLSWNEFLIAASVARRKAMVLSIAVASFVTDKGILWGQMSAMAVVMIVPMLLFALFVQRYLIRGITLGAVKG